MLAGGLDVEQLEDRRHEVDTVMVLGANAPGVLDALWPVHDQGVTDAATERIHLEPLQRRVAGKPPAFRVVVVRVLAAELVDVGQELIDRLVDERVVLADIDVAKVTAFVACAVVRHDHEQRVVELAGFFQVIHQSPHLLVGMLQEPGKHLLHPGAHALFVRAQRIPRAHFVVAVRQQRAGRDDAQLKLAGVPRLAHFVPSLVVPALVLVDIAAWRVVRRVAGAERDIAEKRFVGRGALLVADELDRLVDQILGEVVILALRLGDRVVVAE